MQLVAPFPHLGRFIVHHASLGNATLRRTCTSLCATNVAAHLERICSFEMARFLNVQSQSETAWQRGQKAAASRECGPSPQGAGSGPTKPHVAGRLRWTRPMASPTCGAGRASERFVPPPAIAEALRHRTMQRPPRPGTGRYIRQGRRSRDSYRPPPFL